MNTNFKDLVKNLVKELKVNGGFSVDINGHSPKSGFMVSVPTHEWVTDKVSQLTLSAFLKAKKSMLKNDRLYAGGWYDNKSEQTFIDLSVNVETLTEAKKLAEKYNQLAIWDVENSKEIRF